MAGNAGVDVAIVGAGAAGLSAARALRAAGKSFVVLEASHRIGGRAYTETLRSGEPFDLGCHWMHSASLNPFVQIADDLGAAYLKEGFWRGSFRNGAWDGDDVIDDWGAFFDRQYDRMGKVAENGDDCSVFEATERDHQWTRAFDYVLSLISSFDPDQVSVKDLIAYTDTEENWPLTQGYGTLISTFFADIPVSLNSAVSAIDWSGSGVRLTTAKGVVEARRALITVSTGILGAGDIRFTPGLPGWKRDAIAAVPLGNHNRICLIYDRDVFGPDAPKGFMADVVDETPMAITVRPFGYNYVVGVTGGRFADWLERAGQQASADYVERKLQAVFGIDITKHVTAHVVTAWRGDPWVKGAYSSAVPGQAHQRAKLAEPVDERLYFAGEATSPNFYSTAHGAYLSGIAAAERMAG